MTLLLDKPSWKRVRLGDVVRRSRKQVDPLEAGTDRYVAGGHIDSDAVTVERWGDPSDGQMGSTFRYAFEPGQILFVSARPYLRKMGVVNFSGVVADKTYVLDAVPENGLLQEFLPFILSSDRFVDYATSEATGSMNPRLLWGPFQRYEFDLPSLDEQERIADLLWAIERHRQAVTGLDDPLLSCQAPLLEVEAESYLTVDDVVLTARSGATPSRSNKEFYGGDIPWLKSGEVVGDAISTTEEFITEAGLAGSSTWLVPEGAVVVAMYGDGKTRGQVGRLAAPMSTNQAVLALVADASKADPDFLYYWLRSRQEELRGKGAGAAQKNLSKQLVVTEPFPDLPVAEQAAAVEQVIEIDRVRNRVIDESKALSTLRSSVLAEIFGGN
ncbi:restriction endonuclease subunit S [Streptomyces sp. DSM 118878]